MNSRDKGARGEREWAQFCREEGLCPDAERGFPRKDIIGMRHAHWEVKRTEKVRIYKAVAQAVADARENEVPMVAHRRNRDEWLVTLRAKDLKRLAEVLGSAVQEP